MKINKHINPSCLTIGLFYFEKTDVIKEYGLFPSTELSKDVCLLVKYVPVDGICSLVINAFRRPKGLQCFFGDGTWKRFRKPIGYRPYACILRASNTESLLVDYPLNIGGKKTTFHYRAYISYEIFNPEKLFVKMETAGVENTLKMKMWRELHQVIKKLLNDTNYDPNLRHDTNFSEVFLNEMKVWGLNITNVRVQYE